MKNKHATKFAVITATLALLSCVPESTKDTKEAQALAQAIKEGKVAVGTTSLGTSTTSTSTTSTPTVPTTTTSTTTTTGGVVVTTTSSALSSVTAFQQTVYPIARKYCSNCHIAGNQPFFAVDDVVRAHDALITQNKINFTDTASSRMVDRLLRDGHHCWSNCTADAQEMLAAINSWKTLKTPVVTTTTTPVTPASARMATIKLTVPAVLPTGGDAAANFVTMSFTLNSDLDTINPNIVGATFTMEIQKFDDYSYRMRNPKIITTTSAVSVKDIQIAVNGSIRQNDATYILVERAVATGAAGTVLSTTPMVFLIDKGAGQDQINISFGSISKM